MKYYISTLNFSPDVNNRISTVLPKMVKKKIKNIEISSFHPYEEGIEKLIKEYSNDYNILIHNFTPQPKKQFLLNLSDTNNDKRTLCREFIEDKIILSKDINSDYYSFHSGFRVNWKMHKYIYKYKHNTSRLKALGIFISEVNKILDVAESEKVHIGIENHNCIKERNEDLILYNIDDWEYLFNNISSNYLHLHLDLGHLKIASNQNGFDKYDFIKRFGDKIIGIHVNDNVGTKIDSHSPFDVNNFWFGSKQLQQMPHLRYCCLETITYEDMNLIKDMIEYLKRERNEYTLGNT